jgi:DNA invertase Pin-like site-specific DNA recombinase
MGRSLPELVATPKEAAELRIGFVPLTKAFDMARTQGRVLGGMLAVFATFEQEKLQERIKAGITEV